VRYRLGAHRLCFEASKRAAAAPRATAAATPANAPSSPRNRPRSIPRGHFLVPTFPELLDTITSKFAGGKA
jgi:hypothetical protein